MWSKNGDELTDMKYCASHQGVAVYRDKAGDFFLCHQLGWSIVPIKKEKARVFLQCVEGGPFSQDDYHKARADLGIEV